ncbi:MAG: hypothetical protein AB8H80_08160 [Planctomycetota bacterium]
MKFSIAAAVFACFFGGAIAAQRSPQRPPSIEDLPAVALPDQDLHVSAMRSFSNGLTSDSTGRLWSLVQAVDRSAAARRELRLAWSSDHGRTWQSGATLPGAWAAYGAVAGEPRSNVLHLAWAGRREGDKWSCALYQRYDTEQQAFLGEPEALQVGVGKQDQFGVADLAIDAAGQVAVLVTTHRRPQRPPWPSGWSSGLMLRERGLGKWSKPYPLNTNTYGVWPSLQLHDGRAFAAYRTSPHGSVIGYRSFAVAARAFDQKDDVVVSRTTDGRAVANASSLLVDAFGGRTLVYPSARERGDFDGRLRIAYAEPGEDSWQTSVVVTDKRLQSGNLSHEHFALVRGPGRQVVVLYSKVTEEHRVLYRRTYDGGQPMEAERVVAQSELAGAFRRISAARDERLLSPVWALVSANVDDPAAKYGVRAVLAPRVAPPRWQ